MSHSISSVLPSCTIVPLTRRRDPLVAEVPVGDDARTDRAQGVRALDAQHRAGVGVTEVVQAEVVGDRVPGDVRSRLVTGDVSACAPDHDRDLAFVVEPLAAIRPHHRASMAVERTDRLVEVGRSRRQLGHELVDPTPVVEVNADDLGRHDRSEMGGGLGSDGATITGDEVVTQDGDRRRVAVEQDSAVLGHGWLPGLCVLGVDRFARR